MSNFDSDQNPYAAPSGDGKPELDARAFAEIHERELGAFAILGLALRVFAARPLLIICIAVVVGLPVNIFSATQDSADVDIETMSDVARSIRSTVWLDALFGVVASLALAKVTEVVVRGESTSSKEIIVHSLRRLLSGIGTRIMYSIGCGLLSCLLIVPGIAFALYWYFHDSAVALRGMGGRRALAYSKRLVEGRWWRVFVVVLLTVFLVMGAAFGISLGVGLVIGLLGVPPMVSLVGDSVIDVFGAVLAIAMTIYFLNLEWLATRNGESRVVE